MPVSAMSKSEEGHKKISKYLTLYSRMGKKSLLQTFYMHCKSFNVICNIIFHFVKKLNVDTLTLRKVLL